MRKITIMITSETEVSSKIDWYAYTALRPAWHNKHTMKGRHMERGMYGYTIGIEFADGRIEMTNPDHARMKTFVQYSGSALDAGWLDYGIDPMVLLRLRPPQMQVNRIDIAVDVRGGMLDIAELVNMAENGDVTTLARKFYSTRTLSGGGHTLYVGSPKSKMRLRIYDKAAEQMLKDTEWTRIELQVRGKRADEVRTKLLNGSGGDNRIGSIIKGFCDFPKSIEYSIAVSNTAMATNPPHRKETNTEKWLLQSCLPSLAKAIARDRDGSFLLKWENALEEEITEYEATVVDITDESQLTD